MISGLENEVESWSPKRKPIDVITVVNSQTKLVELFSELNIKKNMGRVLLKTCFGVKKVRPKMHF